MRSADGVGVFSVNKKLGSLSNLGLEFCVVGTRISPEVWVADFAMSGWFGNGFRITRIASSGV